MRANNHLSILLAYLILPMSWARAADPMGAFSSQEGRFSVYMEGKPIAKTANLGGISSAKCYAHDEKDGGYWVTWTDVPIARNSSPETINRSLNGSCSGAVAGIHGKETARYTVNLQGGYLGRQIEGTLPKGQGFFCLRLYLVGDRLYQLAVVGSKPYLKESSPNQFLNSLSISHQTASPTSPTTGSSSSQGTSADMQRQSEEMQARSAARHQKMQEQQDRARKDREAARARREQGW
jgi:hypothetical protein